MVTKILILIGALIVATLVYYVCYVWRLRKWLRSAKVDDICKSDEFKSRMRREIKMLLAQRAKEQAALGSGARLKSHPIEHLQDEGVLNADDMTELYIHSLQKTLIGYSMQERQFIHDVGMLVYRWTMQDLMNRACMQVRKKGGEA